MIKKLTDAVWCHAVLIPWHVIRLLEVFKSDGDLIQFPVQEAVVLMQLFLKMRQEGKLKEKRIFFFPPHFPMLEFSTEQFCIGRWTSETNWRFYLLCSSTVDKEETSARLFRTSERMLTLCERRPFKGSIILSKTCTSNKGKQILENPRS